MRHLSQTLNAAKNALDTSTHSAINALIHMKVREKVGLTSAFIERRPVLKPFAKPFCQGAADAVSSYEKSFTLQIGFAAEFRITE